MKQNISAAFDMSQVPLAASFQRVAWNLYKELRYATADGVVNTLVTIFDQCDRIGHPCRTMRNDDRSTIFGLFLAAHEQIHDAEDNRIPLDILYAITERLETFHLIRIAEPNPWGVPQP